MDLLEQWMKDQSPLIKRHGLSKFLGFRKCTRAIFQTGLIVYNVSNRWLFYLTCEGNIPKGRCANVHLTPGDARHINEGLFSKLTQRMSEENAKRYRMLIESRIRSPNLEAIGIVGGIATLM